MPVGMRWLNLCFTPALTFYPLPGEREQPALVFRFLG